MAQTAPSPNQTDNRTNPANLVPPDEQFWQHYSPHGEFPLSSVGSFVIHALLFGLLALIAWLGVVLFDQSKRTLPVEAVRLDLGGGGGNERGRGEGANTGAAPKEVGNQGDETQNDKNPPENVPPPEIKIDPNPKVKQSFEDPTRRMQETVASTSASFSRLRQTAARIQAPGSPPSGAGKGGTGKGGGSGSGDGPGIGDGKGPGVATPTEREKRMLRWSMLFKVNNSPEYVAQLNGLGAILAIPVREDANGAAEYEIVRNLSARPAKLVKENIKEIQRMVYWVDEKPESVQGVMFVLGLQQVRANHFLAFMPEALERKLLSLEISYLHRKHPDHKEDAIASTRFEIQVRKGKYEPVVIEQKLK
jgi:hypothetical protein